MSSNVDIFQANAGRCRVYTRSADISRRDWRRLMLLGMSCQSENLTIRYKSSFHVCSPDIAIRPIEYIALRKSLTSKLSMSSRITKARKRYSRNQSCRLKGYRNRRAKEKRQTNLYNQGLISMESARILLEQECSSSLNAAQRIVQVSLLLNHLLDENGSMTTAKSYFTSGNT